MKPAEERTEMALRVSREKYTKLFQASQDAILLSRRSDFAILECNDGFSRLTGYAPEEVIGNTVLGLELWDELEDRQGIIDELRDTGGYAHREVRFRVKDGTERIISISGAEIEIDGEVCVLAIGHDVTERKRAEDRLRAVTEAA